MKTVTPTPSNSLSYPEDKGMLQVTPRELGHVVKSQSIEGVDRTNIYNRPAALGSQQSS